MLKQVSNNRLNPTEGTVEISEEKLATLFSIFTKFMYQMQQNPNYIPHNNDIISHDDSAHQSAFDTDNGLDHMESSTFVPETYIQDSTVEPDLEQELGLSGVQDDQSSSELVTKVITVGSHVKVIDFEMAVIQAAGSISVYTLQKCVKILVW